MRDYPDMQGTREDRLPAAIGRRLEITREALEIKTQREFAQRAGIEPNAYNQWKQGRGRPDLDQAIRLADTYDISLDWIYFGDQRRLAFEIIDAVRRHDAIDRR